jgi:PAS domain-containing protein
MAGVGNVSVVNSDGATAHGKPLQLILARELASNLATPMTIMDARGMLVFYNDAAAQLIGKPFAEIGEIPSEEFGAVLRMKTLDGRVLRRRESPSGVSFNEHRPSHQTHYATGYDGVEHLVHSTAYPLFGTNGEMHGVVSVFWEVADQEGTP